MIIRFTALYLLLWVLVPSLVVYAHGQNHDLEELLYTGSQGPYEITVTAVPLVNYLEVLVQFENQTWDRLKLDPRIRVSATQENLKLNPVIARQAFSMESSNYAALLHPPTEGNWNLSVSIDSDQGATNFFLPVEIRSRDSFPWLVAMSAISIFVTIIWLIYARFRRKISSE